MVAMRQQVDKFKEITQIAEFWPRRPRRPTKTALSYDANGNLLDDGEYLYAWDAFNRLIEVRLKRNSRIVGQYFYDAMHRRTRRLANLDHNASLETQATYAYDGFNCISEISNLSSEIRDYVWGNDINGGPQAAGGVGGLVAVLSFSPQPSVYYPLFDARGNITAYTGSTGSITATFDYLPFGALASSTGNVDAFSYRFSTKPFDAETGLVYYNYRYYSPELGRWMSRDPMEEEGGLNIYVVSVNNIINNYDFNGLFKIKWGEGIGRRGQLRIVKMLKDIKERSREAIERIDQEIQNLKDGECECKQEKIAELEKTKEILQGVIDDINSDRKIVIDLGDTGDVLGNITTYPLSNKPDVIRFSDQLHIAKEGERHYEDQLRTLFHEISHRSGSIDIDKPGVTPGSAAQYLESLMGEGIDYFNRINNIGIIDRPKTKEELNQQREIIGLPPLP